VRLAADMVTAGIAVVMGTAVAMDMAVAGVTDTVGGVGAVGVSASVIGLGITDMDTDTILTIPGILIRPILTRTIHRTMGIQLRLRHPTDIPPRTVTDMRLHTDIIRMPMFIRVPELV
jgi:hypothetical protein